MKGLIPAAGMGTRMRPFTKAIPKELMPVGDKAVIGHVIDMFKVANILDIVIIVGWRKHAILDYLGSGEELGVRLTYVVQDEPNGLAMAFKAGEHAIAGENFASMLGDNFYRPMTALRDLVDFHEENAADLTLGVVDVEDTTRHGIVEGIQDVKIEDTRNSKKRSSQSGKDGSEIFGKVLRVIEKPRPEDTLSRLGSAGMYIFTPEIFDAIAESKPGLNGEYQIADSINILIDWGAKVMYHKIGLHIDVGTLEDLKIANELVLLGKDLLIE